MIVKTAIIRKLKNGKYRLYSRKKDPSGKRRNLGTYDSLEAVKKREQDIQYFKHQADDGAADDKQTKMLGNLSDIATYLEESGFIDKADLCYDVMAAIDGSMAADDEKKFYLGREDVVEVDPREYKRYGDDERFMYTLENGKVVDVRKQLNPSIAKEIIRNIAKVGTIRYGKKHTLEKQLKTNISSQEISRALQFGKACQPEQEYGEWRYRVTTAIGGGFYLIVKIENNRTLSVITAFETEQRRYLRQRRGR